MARDFQINGECLVKVKGGAHISGFMFPEPAELGLAAEGIVIEPRFYHEDIRCDDFGPSVPADVMWNLAEVNIRMLLIHYDVNILDYCLSEAMGGTLFSGNIAMGAGIVAPAGVIMGGYKNYFASGWHYISLNLLSPVLGLPWRFRAAYLTGQPLKIPLSTEKTVVELNWRAIPYAVPTLPLSGGASIFSALTQTTSGGLLFQSAEISSSGVPLFDNTLDTGVEV